MIKENTTASETLAIDKPLSRRDFENYMGKFIAKLVIGVLILIAGILIVFLGFSGMDDIPTEVLMMYPQISGLSICTSLLGIFIAILGVVIICSGIQPTADKKKNRIKKEGRENGSV